MRPDGKDTSLENSSEGSSENEENDVESSLLKNDESVHETSPLLQSNSTVSAGRLSAQDYYFGNENSSIKKYYKFTSSSLTPFAALLKQPTGNVGRDGTGQGVTGLLRRSAGTSQ